MSKAPLVRSRADHVIGGVCAGLAAHLGLPPRVARIAMVIFGLMGGAGVAFYLWLWATVPLDGETEPVVPLRRAFTKPSEPTAPDGEAGPTAPPGGSIPGSAAPPLDSPGSSGGPDPTTYSGPAQSDPSRPSATQAAAPHAPPVAASIPRTLSERFRWPVAEFVLGVSLLVTGILLVLHQLGVRIDLQVALPGLAVLVGVGLTWWQIADRKHPDRNQVPRVLGALSLVAVGILMFFVTANQPSVWTVIMAAVAVLAGVALAISPWLLRINRELIAERAGREREAERAEIAAHLHDSVLQTLALIQQRSEPGSDVARLARGQERELREWLFRAADSLANGAESRSTIVEELTAHAAALEGDHAVKFEMVTVGASTAATAPGADAPEAIVAAAREAMLNAARHAGGTVTVYLEVTPTRVTVDVTDRGSGVDLDALPDGRMGIKESILGRMDRAGGTARIVPGPGGTGTSVRLAIPCDGTPHAASSSSPSSSHSSHSSTGSKDSSK